MILPSDTTTSTKNHQHHSYLLDHLHRREKKPHHANNDGGKVKLIVNESGELVEEEVIAEEHEEEESEEEHHKFLIANNRSLPIISGLLAPFSVLLDIPGLTEKWYVRTEGFKVIETRSNPTVIVIAMALSIALGLLANLALITRFMEKKVLYSTYAAILFLTVHDIVNALTIVIFGVLHRFEDGFTWGDAYYMAIASTIVSTICNVTLIVDFFAIKDFRNRGSGLTEKQRSLVVAVMVLLCYIALGSLVFSFLLSLTYINALYFTICTVTTVGFGDEVPFTVASKIFSIPFDLIGITLLGFTILIARTTVIETFEKSYKIRRSRIIHAGRRRRERILGKKKEKKERERERNGIGSDGNSVSEIGVNSNRTQTLITMDFEEGDEGMEEVKSGVLSVFYFRVKKIFHQFSFTSTNQVKKLSTIPVQPQSIRIDTSIPSTPLNETQEKEFNFHLLQKQIEKEHMNEFRIKIFIALFLFFSFWLVGASVFHVTEGWTYLISLYFCFIFFTTIGYGDYSPHTQVGRAFFIVWAMFGVATMTLLLSVVTETWSYRYKSSISNFKNHRLLQATTNTTNTSLSLPTSPISPNPNSKSKGKESLALLLLVHAKELEEMRNLNIELRRVIDRSSGDGSSGNSTPLDLGETGINRGVKLEEVIELNSVTSSLISRIDPSSTSSI